MQLESVLRFQLTAPDTLLNGVKGGHCSSWQGLRRHLLQPAVGWEMTGREKYPSIRLCLMRLLVRPFIVLLGLR